MKVSFVGPEGRPDLFLNFIRALGTGDFWGFHVVLYQSEAIAPQYGFAVSEVIVMHNVSRSTKKINTKIAVVSQCGRILWQFNWDKYRSDPNSSWHSDYRKQLAKAKRENQIIDHIVDATEKVIANKKQS